MENKSNMNLQQAMQLLNLKTGFTEEEFKRKYRKLMMSIHPDAIDANDVTRDFLEEKAKDVNIAKGIIEKFLKENSVKEQYPKGEYKEKEYVTNENEQEKQRETEIHQVKRSNTNLFTRLYLNKMKRTIISFGILSLILVIAALSITNFSHKNKFVKQGEINKYIGQRQSDAPDSNARRP